MGIKYKLGALAVGAIIICSSAKTENQTVIALSPKIRAIIKIIDNPHIETRSSSTISFNSSSTSSSSSGIDSAIFTSTTTTLPPGNPYKLKNCSM